MDENKSLTIRITEQQEEVLSKIGAMLGQGAIPDVLSHVLTKAIETQMGSLDPRGDKED